MKKFNIENSGTYKIINTLNGKYYPGSAKNMQGNSRSRKYRHFWMLRNNCHHCDHLQNAYNLAEDKSIFIFVVQKNNIPINELKIEEQKILDIARTEPEMCYTKNFISDRIEMTEEVRKKISDNHADVSGENNPRFRAIISEEQKQKVSKTWLEKYENGYINPVKGKPCSEEKKEKLRIKHTGKILSEEHCKAISEGNKKTYENGRIPPSLGKKASEETKEKMSESQLERYVNGDEGYWKDKHLSNEHKRKLSEALLGEKSPWFGRKHKEESKLKISKARKIKIKQLDKITGEVIKIWDSIKEANEGLNRKNDSISHVLQGRTKSAYGYKWEYV